MIGDKLTYHSDYSAITAYVVSAFKDRILSGERLCFAVSGESGCGKTSLAYALKIDIEKTTETKGFMFHGDDYFNLPPADNHQARLDDINSVGMEEVNLKLLDAHLKQFKNPSTQIKKPLVHYSENRILEEDIDTSKYNFCIVEGTYTSTLKTPNYKIFIQKTYMDTMAFRKERGREAINGFNERVLEIEHNIIKGHFIFADMLIDKDLNMTTN